MTSDLDDYSSLVGDLYRLATAMAEHQHSDREEPSDALSLPTSPDLALALTEAFAQILFECRGALDYAEESSTHLLANRVVSVVGKSLSDL